MQITEPVWILGTMSGTSLDGVDAALIRTDGEEIAQIGPHEYRPYSAEEREMIARALGQWAGGPDVAAAAQVVEAAHIEVMAGLEGAAVAGFHGQTLAHDPGGRGTHQAGDGAVISKMLKLPVVWNFRRADMEKGGQGAPLAPFYHFALAKYIGAEAPLAFLNLGGVGNITYVDPAMDRPEDAGALMAFDTGPANAPLNDLMQARRGLEFDADGALAASGTVHQPVIDTLLNAPYFAAPPPKSLDRDGFAGLQKAVQDLCDEDAAATLAACMTQTVKAGFAHLPQRPARLLVTGGGRKNAHVMAELARLLPCEVVDIDQTGLNGDMLEAQAFAYLAARVLRDLPTSCPATTGASEPVGGGFVTKYIPPEPVAFIRHRDA